MPYGNWPPLPSDLTYNPSQWSLHFIPSAFPMVPPTHQTCLCLLAICCLLSLPGMLFPTWVQGSFPHLLSSLVPHQGCHPWPLCLTLCCLVCHSAAPPPQHTLFLLFPWFILCQTPFSIIPCILLIYFVHRPSLAHKGRDFCILCLLQHIPSDCGMGGSP